MLRANRHQGRIPVLATGILLFFVSLGSGANSELARELFLDGEWDACRREILRANPEPSPDSFYAWLLGIAELRGGSTPVGIRRLEQMIAHPAADPALRAGASFALGTEARSTGRLHEAAGHFADAFVHAPTPELFQHGGCALYHLLLADKDLRRTFPVLWPQLQSASAAWPRNLHTAHRLPRPTAGRFRSWAVWPFTTAVRFYQRHIGPAIGTRCQLHPSCSAFFMQTARRHGWWAVPMYGDRAIREPSIIQAREEVVAHHGRLLVHDAPAARIHPRARTSGRRPATFTDPIRRLADAN